MTQGARPLIFLDGQGCYLLLHLVMRTDVCRKRNCHDDCLQISEEFNYFQNCETSNICSLNKLIAALEELFFNRNILLMCIFNHSFRKYCHKPRLACIFNRYKVCQFFFIFQIKQFYRYNSRFLLVN